MGRPKSTESARNREILISMRKEGKSPEEIALALNYKVSTVRQLIQRAGLSIVETDRHNPKRYNYSGMIEYRIEGMSIPEISGKTEIPIRRVEKYLREHGALHEEDLAELRESPDGELTIAKPVSIGRVCAGGKVWLDVTDALFETPDDIYDVI